MATSSRHRPERAAQKVCARATDGRTVPTPRVLLTGHVQASAEEPADAALREIPLAVGVVRGVPLQRLPGQRPPEGPGLPGRPLAPLPVVPPQAGGAAGQAGGRTPGPGGPQEAQPWPAQGEGQAAEAQRGRNSRRWPGRHAAARCSLLAAASTEAASAGGEKGPPKPARGAASPSGRRTGCALATAARLTEALTEPEAVQARLGQACPQLFPVTAGCASIP